MTTTQQQIPFDKLYSDGEKQGPLMPWNIGGPQPAIRALADEGSFHGRVIDLGCGLGDNALYLASTGLDVTGVDISQVAVDCAQNKADRTGLPVAFRTADAFSLAEEDATFDAVLDSAFFHTLSAEDAPAYCQLINAITVPGSTLDLFAFSKEMTPDFPGPRRVSAGELRALFSADWEIHSIASARYSSSLPAEAVAQMVDPRTFEIEAPTRNLTAVDVDESGCVVSTIWHLHAQRRGLPDRTDTTPTGAESHIA